MPRPKTPSNAAALALSALFTGSLIAMSPMHHRERATALALQQGQTPGILDRVTGAVVAWFGWDDEEDEPAPYEVSADGTTAIIRISGVLYPACSWWMRYYGYCDTQEITEAVIAAGMDANISRIILHGTSPGGRVDYVAELADAVRAVRDAGEKEIVGYIDNLGCSALYWVLSQCEKIYCNRTAMVGCLGTMTTIIDWSGYYKQLGILPIPITSDGAETFKPEGLTGTTLTEPQQEDIKRLCNETNVHFKGDVMAGRGWTEDTATKLFDGRIHVGPAAKALGLVDAVLPLAQLLGGQVPDDDSAEGTGDEDDLTGEEDDEENDTNRDARTPGKKGKLMSLMDTIKQALRQEGYRVEKVAPGDKPGATAVSGAAPVQSAESEELAKFRAEREQRLTARRTEVEAAAVTAYGNNPAKLEEAKKAIAATSDMAVLGALESAYQTAVPPSLRPGQARVSSGVRMDGDDTAPTAPTVTTLKPSEYYAARRKGR